MTVVFAVDPGPERSAWLVYNTGPIPVVGTFAITDNTLLVAALRELGPGVDVVAIEQIESFGMAVGREVFETVRWAGRFEEAVQPLPVALVPRRTVKLALCGDSRAKDTNIRQALLDRFGGSRAVGRKADPGPLYGISRDVWSALAIAVAWQDGRPDLASSQSHRSQL